MRLNNPLEMLEKTKKIAVKMYYAYYFMPNFIE